MSTGATTGAGTPTVFDLAGRLPGPGVTALEASAGTGKTWAVASLVARYVAEGTPLHELLVITFSRAATQELRDRVRSRLVEAVACLDEPDAASGSDALHTVLTTDEAGRPLNAAERGVRRDRLRAAVADYDAATILTTHGFCDLVLRSLGVAGDSDATERLVEDVDDLVEDVLVDTYLRRWADSAEEPPIDVADARRVARAAVDHLRGRIEPAGSVEPRSAALVSFAGEVVAEVAARKRAGRLLTFDDLLTRLADAVEAPGSAAAARMRARWPVVLVDEFQDTDDVQWRVLDGAFGTGETTLVLIGDPKQAIYAFRGGDTPTYLRAVRGAQRQTLATNWRSDAAVVDALQALTRGAALGDADIVVHPVSAARADARLAGVAAGVRLRQLPRAGHPLNGNGTLKAPSAPHRIALDVADDIARLLRSGATYDGRPLAAGDIAILLPSVRWDGARILDALRAKRIPYVVNTAETVMGGEAARHWTTLLRALEQPQRTGRVRAAALTPFLGHTPEQLDAGGDDLVDSVAERIRGWLDLLRSRGVAAVVAAAHATGMARRVLAQAGGERLLTDLDHIGELLHEAAAADRLGVTGLVGWLEEAIEEGARHDARRRRLDVDADAVQVLTIHGAKGLEFPVVYLPQLYERKVNERATVHAYHDGDDRCLDVAGTPSAARAARREAAQEDLRLAYVALTRATSLVVAWWAPTWNAAHGGLSRLLLGREPHQPTVAEQVDVPPDDAAADARLRRWAEAGAFVLETAEPTGEEPLALARVPERLAPRRFTRTVDTAWRRTSYSGLVRADEQLVTASSEPEESGTVDEEPVTEDVPSVAVAVAAPDAPLSPMATMPPGATFGSLVHAVLEHADPQAADLEAELCDRVEEQRRWWGVDAPTEDIARALLPLHDTRLGPLADDLTLRQIGQADRLCELDFEFPMAGGDRAGAVDLPLAAFAGALRRHLPVGDPVRGYADRLEAPALGEQRLRGYLSGSIDVVLRVPDAAAPGGARFVVVDYKTNSLGEPGTPSTAWDYRPDALAAAMLHSHYPLQALLYTVVLHRYLRWRLGAGYDAERHLGGVLYLYVRGMCGPETPVVDGVPCGVFSWRPPVALVEELSALLAGDPVAEVAG